MKYLSTSPLGITLVLGLCFVISGCSRRSPEAPAAAAIPVTVSYPVEREVTDYSDFTARTAAVDSVEVRGRVWGYLDQVNFTEGALVEKGALLAVIDPRPFEAELNRAKAQLEQARANVAQSTAQLAQSRAQETKAQANLVYAQSRLERSKTLRNAITKEEFELHQSELLQAEAEREAAKALTGSSQAAIASAKAAVETAQAAIGIAELNLEYTRLEAPIGGRVGRTMVTQGNLLQSADQAGGTVLTSIVSVDTMYAYFDVDEPTVLRVRRLIREGKARSARESEWPVSLGLANEEGFPHQGTINFVDNQVNPKTGTLRVRGVFPNRDEALSPGFFARVRVPIGQAHQALLVSDRAIDTDQGRKVLYVVDEKNEVVLRPVRLGALHNGQRVIEDGLKPGERVIVNGLQQVRPGVGVEPKLVDMPASLVRNHNGTARLANATP